MSEESVHCTVIDVDGLQLRSARPFDDLEHDLHTYLLGEVAHDRDELAKQLADAMFFGSGWALRSADGCLKHIPFHVVAELDLTAAEIGAQ